jgi:DNA-binding NarL/FixJ family response regulator
MRPTRPITVLIADDHPIFRRGLCDIIAADASLRLVGEAADGEQAWQLIQKLQPAVAVLDIHMPKRSGIQLGRLLLQQRLRVELIILTMDAEEALLNEALNLGVKGYLLKETAVTDLLQAIHRVAIGDSYISPALSGALLRRNAACEALQEQKLGLATLTPTERQILKLIAEDRTSKEIAEVLGCSIRTVETHRQNISRKLELSGSHSLLRFAFDHKAQL